MASLTRTDYIEMWATMKAMEYDMLHFPYSQHSPYAKRQQRKVVVDTLRNINFIKNQIQVVIGQME